MHPANLCRRSSNRRGAAIALKIEARIERNTRSFQCPNSGREVVNGGSKHGRARPISIWAGCPICKDTHEWQVVGADHLVALPVDQCPRGDRLAQAQGMLQDLQCRNTQIIELSQQLLDEFSCRLRNNQEILLGLLQAVIRKTGNSEARQLLSDTSQRIGAMGAAQQLFYSAGHSTDVSARTFLEAVCANAKAFLSKEISIDSERVSGSLPKETMMPLALVLNELLANAAKHGINDRGRVAINVGLSQRSGLHELYVQDSGPGFNFDEAQASPGLGLVTMLAQRLRGAFTVERRSGARCTLRFPDQ